MSIWKFGIFTGRNEVLAKVILSEACVILSTGGGCLLQIFGGGCLLQIFGGGGLRQIFGGGLVPGGLQFSEYGQRSAGTHATGMHSCLLLQKSFVVDYSDTSYFCPLQLRFERFNWRFQNCNIRVPASGTSMIIHTIKKTNKRKKNTIQFDIVFHWNLTVRIKLNVPLCCYRPTTKWRR